MSLVTPPLSLYVHLPWCVRKCPYCDFNSHERRGALPFTAYIDALVADLDASAAELDPATKHARSHRGLALNTLRARLHEL